MMTTNPTMELSGCASAPYDTESIRADIKVQLQEFQWQLASYRDAEKIWDAAIGADREEKALRHFCELSQKLLAFPCLSPEMLACKVGTFLDDTGLMEWLSGDTARIRILLSSLMCVHPGDAKRLSALCEVVRGGPVASVGERLEAAKSLLWVLLPSDPPKEHAIPRHIVEELVEHTLLLLMGAIIELNMQKPAKRQRAPKDLGKVRTPSAAADRVGGEP